MSLRTAALSALCVLASCKRPEEQVDPKIRADGYYLSGTSAFLQGDLLAAHAAFAEVRSLNPTDPRLPAAEGEVYLAESKLPEAIQRFEEATRLDPARSTNWGRLGYLYLLKRDLSRARPALEKAVALNPKDVNAHEALADLQLQEDDVEGAAKHFLLAADAAHGADRAELVLRATAELMKRKQGTRALEVLEGAVQKGIESAPLLSELGDRLVEAQRLPDAALRYQQAAALDPKDPTLWELVGEVRLKLGEWDDAERAFGASLAVRDRSVVHVALARLCQHRKDGACLARELDQALRTAQGEELRETLELADLLASVGRKKDALTLLKTVSEEPDQKGNLALQLKAARLARELKDDATLKAACARVLSGGPAGQRCP